MSKGTTTFGFPNPASCKECPCAYLITTGRFAGETVCSARKMTLREPGDMCFVDGWADERDGKCPIVMNDTPELPGEWGEETVDEYSMKIQQLTQEVARWKGRAVEAAARACQECEEYAEGKRVCEECRIRKIKDAAGQETGK